MRRATLTIADRPDSLPSIREPGRLALLPASGRLDDHAAVSVARLRESSGLASRLLIPVRFGRYRDGIDTRLLGDERRLAVIDVSTWSEGLPLVLDLVARYASPLMRVKVTAHPRRVSMAVDLARRCPLASTVMQLKDGRWIEIDDMVAAEVVAVMLRDLEGGDDVAMESPWQDELVQAAADLGLGVRVPSEIDVVDARSGDRGGPDSVLMALHLRVGVDIPLP